MDMMNPVLLIQLTENDKRIIFALCIVIILLFVVIGLLGSLVVRTMKWQGKKCDTLVSDVVTNKIVTTNFDTIIFYITIFHYN